MSQRSIFSAALLSFAAADLLRPMPRREPQPTATAGDPHPLAVDLLDVDATDGRRRARADISTNAQEGASTRLAVPIERKPKREEMRRQRQMAKSAARRAAT